MDHFTYQSGMLHAEQVSIADIAADVGTPFYCYSSATLERHFTVFTEQFADQDHLVCFAVKANSNIAVLRTLAECGSGADVVSEGEIRRALKAGIAPEKIVFSGVAKTQGEMRYALEQRIYQFNVESEPELDALSDVATAMGVEAAIALRINPDVDPKTHAKISTGKKENKFGVEMEDALRLYDKAAALPGIRVQGVSVHIGSQLLDLTPYHEAFSRVRDFVNTLTTRGHHIDTLDLGGGFGIRYGREDEPDAPDLARYATIVREATDGLNCRLIFEPGRMIAGNAGILVTKVIYIKQASQRRFVIADAAMNDLLRPTLYNAYHDIIAVKESQLPRMVADLVGPVCETGDILAEQQSLPECEAGDLLALRSAGAYGAVMAFTYNTRLLVPEVMVKGDQFSVIRPRPSYDDLLGMDQSAAWQSA